MKIPYAVLIAASTLLVSLSACEQTAQNSSTALVAKVGGEVISEAELNHAMSRLEALGSDESAQVRGKVLEAIIDQHLISNAARSIQLDKEPQIALALAHAQRQVLAEAYMARMLKDVAKPSDTEINNYYAQHPELFSARRIYRIQEIELITASTRVPEVESQLKQSRNLTDFVAWLKAQGINNKAGLVIKPAEQIPVPILAQLKEMGDGQVTVLATGAERITVLQLLASQAQPVSLDQARGAIERVIQTRGRKDLLDAEVKKLRSSEKIEYGKDFSPPVLSPQAGKAAL